MARKLINKARNVSKRKLATVSALPALAMSSLVFAVDDAEVTAAQTAGETSVGNAATGLIGMVAVIVGIGLVIGLLRRG